MTDKTQHPYVCKILEVSTAHISEATANLVQCQLASVISFEKGDYGWLVYVPSEPGREAEEGFPPDLRTCMEFARSLDCDWIMFDRDGVVIEALPDYDW